MNVLALRIIASLLIGLIFTIWRLTKLRLTLTIAEQEKKHLVEKLAGLQTSQSQDEKWLQEKFENLANRVLSNNSEKIASNQQAQLNNLLAPLKDRLQEFSRKVDDSYNSEAKERHVLKSEIERLINLNLQMSKDANNLTNALKADVKTQGNWGEFQLSRILEISGLREGHEYFTQGKEMNLKSEDGSILKPDVVVNLPDNKHLIIDSKVSLKAYFQAVESVDLGLQTKFYSEHVASVRNHIEQLSKKHYQDIHNLNSPDFVFLFMASEPAFAEALKRDQELFQLAWNRKIILVSPTTLLAVLRTVASIWLRDRQTKNALKIAEEGGNLYDKFVGFVADLEKIGKGLQDAQKFYQESMGKLQFGKGNLISRVEKLRELGTKTKKRLAGDSSGDSSPVEEPALIEKIDDADPN
jgi:DNA recombination protein RmuC